MAMARPVVGISTVFDGDQAFGLHSIGAKYVHAVSEVAACQPLLIPNIPGESAVLSLASTLDGLFLTGGASNIEPRHYGNDDRIDVGTRDPARDKLMFPLIVAMLAAGKPILGVCRGLQEINVALGGTLSPFLWQEHGRMDHRSDKSLQTKDRYEPAHSVLLEQGGRLSGLMDDARRLTVNSLHGQGIARLAEDLDVEARAPDGTIEAASHRDRARFLFAVQWHAEYRVSDIWHHQRLFTAFGEACQQHWKKS